MRDHNSLCNFQPESIGNWDRYVSVAHLGCGDGTTTGVTFTINTLNTNGSGTANLTCGVGCGWNFDIQVSPDRAMFNLVDVSSANPGNYLEGVAIHQ